MNFQADRSLSAGLAAEQAWTAAADDATHGRSNDAPPCAPRTARPGRGARSLAIVLAALACCCGGCNPFAETLTLPIVFDRTGSLNSDGIFFSVTTNNAVLIGDQSDDKAVKGFVSVNLNAVPAGANVTRAVLRFNTSSAFGNPFGDFVTLSVDHVNVVTKIDADSFLGDLLTGSIAPFPALPADGSQQTRELDITAELKADLAAGRPISSYRFQFTGAPTRDGQTDVVFITSFEDDPTSQPVARVTLGP